MLTTLHRFNRIIFNLIHFNNNLNNQTKMELYKDLHNYTNEIILHQNSLETRLNKLETKTTFYEKVEPKIASTFLSTGGCLSKKSSFYQQTR